MSEPIPQAERDAAWAAYLAEEAGKILLQHQQWGRIENDPEAQDLRDMADEMSNLYLLDQLDIEFPDDGVLSEESADSPERLSKSRVWIIDPLDGTREFRENRSDWAVHVGLAIDGVATVGAVSLPALGLVFRSDQPSPPRFYGGRPRLVVSRSRPPAEAEKVADLIGGDLFDLGSAGAKAMAILRGEADIYLHSGGQYEWDSCAPVAVAQAHGLHCSRIDGSPLVYNNPNPYLPDLLICRPEWASWVLDAVAGRLS